MRTKPNQPLWTRDFTIITLGTAVSMLGNAISGFAISLLVLDYTGSVFLYALFMAAFSLPKLVMPLIAGPYLDNFSRKKVIYTLDFISASVFFGVFLVLRAGWFSYVPFLLLCLLIGGIDSVYQVAYDSLYPLLVSEGNFTRAYSIASLIYPLSTIMVPVAAYVYQKVGLAPLFAFNAATFFIAAVFETQIRAAEGQVRDAKKPDLAFLRSEFGAGIGYIRQEKGLLVITAYFFCTMLLGSAADTLKLPFFKDGPGMGVSFYTYAMGANVLGRLAGGLFHYRFRYKPSVKYNTALAVYISITLLEGTLVFCPPAAILCMGFVSGLLAVNSYNIRIAATQSYVPNSYRARYNGAFLTVTTCGSILGELAAGALGEFFRHDLLIAASQALNMAAIFAIMYRGRAHVRPIYNREI